jgi:small subunit ribosomal protein S17
MEKKAHKMVLVGKVESDRMDKTIVVRVERSFMEQRTHKVVRVSKKYKVHDEQEVAQLGDTVEIIQGRPKSKSKYMYLSRVIAAANMGSV